MRADSLESFCQAAVLIVGAEAGGHLVVVGGGIAMVGAEAVVVVGRVVLQHRGEPQGGHTEFVEVDRGDGSANPQSRCSSADDVFGHGALPNGEAHA